MVLERADRDLHTAITHERFAGRDSLKVRSIASEVLKALRHMHKQGAAAGKSVPHYRFGFDAFFVVQPMLHISQYSAEPVIVL